MSDWADEKAKELLPCEDCFRQKQGNNDHARNCPAHYHPAIAQALRGAYQKGRDEQLWDSLKVESSD
jgi:hypothetical protein